MKWKNALKIGIVLIAFILIAMPVYSNSIMDVKKGEQVIDGKSILNNNWANITVTPSNAVSIPTILNFTQTIQVCNKAEDEGYLFLDYNFNEELTQHSLTEIKTIWYNYTYEIPDSVSCEEKGSYPNNKTVCFTKYKNETALMSKDVKENIDSDKIKNWEDGIHYVVYSGSLFKPSECKNYVLNYKPTSQKGKWNMRVWGNYKNDYSCILNESCAYDYILDPVFSTAFSYKQQINITNPSWSINNYTVNVLLNLSNHDFNLTQPDGDDVIFTNYDETVQLGCYKESFDNTTQGNYSVLLTNFSNASTTTIWVYFGNTTMPNQCPEPNDAYLLYDRGNTTTVNSSIWNEFVGAKWTATITNATYAVSMHTSDNCDWNACNNAQLYMIANTTGVLKQTQAYQVDYVYASNSQSTDDVGIQFGFIENSTFSGTFGTGHNMTFNLDNRNRVIAQDKLLATVTAATSARGWYTVRNIKISNLTTSGFVNTSYQILNSSRNLTALNLGTSVNITKEPNNFINESNKVFFAAAIDTGVAAGRTQIGNISIRAYINGTPSLTFGNVENVASEDVTATLDFNNNVFETSNQDYYINLSWDAAGVTNVSAANLSFNGTTYIATFITGNSSFARYGVLNSIRVPLIISNSTTLNMSWSYYVETSTNRIDNSSNLQTVIFALFPQSLNYSVNVTETASNNITSVLSDYGANLTGVTLLSILEWNNSNSTTSTIFAQSSSQINYSFNKTTGLLQDPISFTNLTVNVTPFYNLTFLGQTVTRSSNIPFSTQQVWKMILTDCLSYTTNVTINYEIRDAVTNALIPTANLVGSYDVWNGSSALAREYSISSMNNETPKICMLPDFTTLTSDFNLSASSVGYLTRDIQYSNQSLFVGTINITIFLANESLQVVYDNYVTNAGLNYTRNLSINVTYTCPSTVTADLVRYINGSVNTNNTASCTNSSVEVLTNYIHSQEGEYNISYSLFDSLGNILNITTISFISDLYNPTVSTLNVSTDNPYFNVSSIYNVTLICTDNIYSPLNYTLTANANLLFDGQNANNTAQINETSLSTGTNTIVGICADPFGSTNQTLIVNGFFGNFALIDEVNNIPLDITNLTSVRAYIDDNSSFFDFKQNNVSTINFSTVNDTKFRFELIYPSGTIITRYIDVSLWSQNHTIRVCGNLDGVDHFEQLITSAISRPVLLRSIFASCYVAMDYTRFAYQDKKALKAFTIQQPYYLSTIIDDAEVLISSLDGSIQTEINLDMLELIATPYNFNIIQSALTFQHTGTNQVTIYYTNLNNDAQNATLIITDISNNNILLITDTFVNPNNWTMVFDYTTVNLTNSTIYQIQYLTETAEGVLSNTKTYFNGRGNNGVLLNEISAIVAFLFLLFGLSIASARITFAWFGLVICIANFVILTNAIGGVWYITFLQGLTAIVAVYIGVNLAQQGGDTVT